MKLDVLNRFTDELQFTAEIECSDETPHQWKLRLAILWAIKEKADLSGADLSGADLSGADLSKAYLSKLLAEVQAQLERRNAQ